MKALPIADSLNTLREKVMAKGFASATGCYVDKASGAMIYDVEGREYIDFTGGIAVMNVGHSHPRVVAAIKEQAEKFTHTCFMVLPYEPAVRLAERLCDIVPGAFEKSVMLTNSGAEAVENAVKIARYHTGRQAVIAFENAFHGRTYLGMTLTSKVKPYKYGFGPFVPEIYRMPFAYCYRCPFNLTYPGCAVACADHLEDFFISHVAPEVTAAVIVEPIQGEGGFITPPPEYFPKLKKICEDNGILFIADEIQTGIGRTGTMFAMEQWGVEADITTVAKSLAAGMPLSAVVGRKEIMDSVHAGGIGGTYGGNPVCCSAALAVLDVFETEHLLQKSRELGLKLRRRLDTLMDRYELIGDVRGIGPMLAMELVKDRESKLPAADEAKALVGACREKGLLLLSCGSYGNVVRLLMPLVITDEQLERGLAILEDGLVGLTK
jgi:4-aminobutyrate aminotransferase/(S)-3-amino-2-methylpropionate transaminase